MKWTHLMITSVVAGFFQLSSLTGSESNEEYVRCKNHPLPGHAEVSTDNETVNCLMLQPGQYYCDDPDIDNETQQAVGCSEEHPFVEVSCYPVSGLNCSGIRHNGSTVGFCKRMSCDWTNGKRFEIALLLSVFLGWLGIDRFYLGYPALGLVKFCTFGFMLLWHLVDILLIAMQVVGPADGSHYVMDYFGPGLNRIDKDNYTYIRLPEDES